MPEGSPIILAELMKREEVANKWLIERLIPKNGVTILSGEPGSYKTWMLLDIAIKVAEGGKLFSQFQAEQGAVLMIDEENRIGLIKDRLALLGADPSLPIYFWIKSGFDIEEQVNDLMEFIQKNDIKLVTFDSLVRIHSKDENDARQISEVYKALSLVQVVGATILLTHHHRKDTMNRGGSRNQSLRGSTDILAGLDSHVAVKKKGRDGLEVVQTKSRDAEELEPFGLVVVKGDKFLFEYVGNEQAKVKDKARYSVMDFLAQKQSVSRVELLGNLGGTYGENSIGEAIKELVAENKILEHRGEKNKKSYSLVS
jgi:archaellum biogenesis ATPase FlaH